MKSRDSGSPHADTLLAALIYLMSCHVRSGCPRVAACVSDHLRRIALHPDVAPIVREVCAGLRSAWASEAKNHRVQEAVH